MYARGGGLDLVAKVDHLKCPSEKGTCSLYAGQRLQRFRIEKYSSNRDQASDSNGFQTSSEIQMRCSRYFG